VRRRRFGTPTKNIKVKCKIPIAHIRYEVIHGGDCSDFGILGCDRTDPEDGGGIFLRNFAIHLQGYAVLISSLISDI
jgi:hypothetical protein